VILLSHSLHPYPEAIQLIIHADDWGQHPAVNRAIHSLIREDAITSASILAGGQAVGEACRFAALHPDFCTGAHLSLSYGHSPLASGRSIISLNGGQRAFLSPLSVLEKKGEPADILLETNAQIRFLLSAGIRLTHVDTHQGCLLGIHSGDERLFPVIRKLCREYRLPFKLPRQIKHAQVFLLRCGPD
jgi:chitin disaccharide deacetylase